MSRHVMAKLSKVLRKAFLLSGKCCGVCSRHSDLPPTAISLLELEQHQRDHLHGADGFVLGLSLRRSGSHQRLRSHQRYFILLDALLLLQIQILSHSPSLFPRLPSATAKRAVHSMDANFRLFPRHAILDPSLALQRPENNRHREMHDRTGLYSTVCQYSTV